MSRGTRTPGLEGEGQVNIQHGSTEQLPSDRNSGHQTDPQPENDSKRTLAEWVSLGVSTAIVVGLIAAILFLYTAGGSSVPAIHVQPAYNQIQNESGRYYLPITIKNVGNATAEDVIVEISLSSGGGQPEVSEVTVRFLPGRGSEDATVVFESDPRNGDLTIDVISYLNP